MDAREQHPEEFRAIDAVVDLAEEFACRAATSDYDLLVHHVVRALYVGMVTNVRGAVVLLERWLNVEAAVLTRAAVEKYIDICYILDNGRIRPEELAQRFFDYQAVATFNDRKWRRQLGGEINEEEYAASAAADRQFR